MQLQSLNIGDQRLCVSSERSIFWENEKALILSDLHLGKTGHFRKSGIAVPQSVYKEDLQRLLHLIQYFRAEKVIVVGDMIHSYANKELDLFKRWRDDFSSVEFHLVRGNHDILKASWFHDAGVTLHEGAYTINNFCFQHDADDCDSQEEIDFLFSGHIHPGIVLNGMGKQSLRFPCYHFTSTSCTLPAFSRFTGAAAISPQPGDTVFAIVNSSLFEMKF